MLTILLALRLSSLHLIATECPKTDQGCITNHDDTALKAAILSGDRLMCSRYHTRPQACLEVYDLAYSLAAR